MTDAGESERQDMQQEAADELIGVQAHGFLAIAVGVIAPAKAHVLSVEINQAVVGDGNLVGVAPEVGQHLRGAGERWFGIDHPVVGAKCSIETGECIGFPWQLQLTVSVGCCEQLEILAAEYYGQRSGGEQKAISSGQPAFAVGTECAAGDNRVDMDVLIEILSPGVQHHGGTDFAAEPARIAAELKQGLRGGFEQQVVDESGVALSDRIEVMRQCENEVPVVDVEESAALLLDPAGLFESLALGAVAVATRGILNGGGCAMVTARDKAAERGGAAIDQCVGDFQTQWCEPTELAVPLEVRAYNISNLQCRPCARRWRTDGVH